MYMSNIILQTSLPLINTTNFIKSYFLKVEFIHVFSHTGIHGNDIADGLAKNAVNAER